MPREATITYEEVAAAADTIKANGGKPNQRNVRDQLGRGSYGTIVKLLKRYLDGISAPAEPALALSAPVQKAITDFMEQQLATARAALEAKLVEAHTTIDDLTGENVRQGEAIVELEAAAEALNAEKAALEGRIAQLETDLAAARTDAGRERAAAEEARVDLAKAQLLLEGLPQLQAELQKTRARLDEIDGRREAAEKQAAVAGTERDAARREGTTAAQRVAELERTLAAAIDEAKNATATAAASDGTVQALTAERDALAEALGLERARIARLEGTKPRPATRKASSSKAGGK